MSNPVPDGYSGPLATIADSSGARRGDNIDFFFVEKVDGKTVNDSEVATAQDSAGMGTAMVVEVVQRQVPAQPATFTITGRTHYAAPILALMNTVYEVSGEVSFTPLPDHAYVVKGTLGPGRSAVWIEDRATGAVMDRRIEK